MSLPLPASSSDPSLARRPRSSNGRSDPSTGLEIALSQFGAILTDDERKKLKAQKAGLHDADAVFKFTSELDNLDPVPRGRAVASKLCSLLQTIQSFGQVIDTLVSSNPEIAALIWGSVKLTFMVLVNFTSYFQKFTTLLHGFNHLIPQFHEYGRLFPNSAGLKQAVCKFHLAIVSCCTQIIKLTRLPVLKKAMAAATQSFESQMAPFLSEIRETAGIAKSSIDLAKAQEDQRNHESQTDNQKALMKQVRKSSRGIKSTEEIVMFQAKLQQWEFLLGKLSSHNYEIAYKHARSKRHKGTAEWIFNTQEFRDWFQSDNDAVLYLAGKIGSGKTILTSNVIDYIKRHKTIRISISFFFIRFDDLNSQDPDTILRSIIRQALARQSVDNMSELLDLLRVSEYCVFDHESLLDLSIRKIELTENCFIILDGLDECSPQNQHDILEILATLRLKSQGCRIKIMISARDSVAQHVGRSFPFASRLIVGSWETDQDLLRYAEEILREKQERDWCVGDQSLIHEILRAISFGGDGMFLWVFLTIEDICTRRSDDEIRNSLRSIPRNLPETFDRALQRIKQKGNAEIAQSVFKWAVAVCYPLTLRQIAEVIMIKPNQPDSRASQPVNGIQHLPAWCENLIHVEEDSETIHFCHHSIRTYLLDNTPKPSDFSLNSKLCNHYVGEVCLTYLHFNDFQRALSTTSQIRPMRLEQVPLGVVDQTLTTIGGHHLGERASRILKKPFGMARANSSRNRSLEGLLSSATPDNTCDYPFLSYARDNWIHHTKDVEESSSTWGIWQNMDVFAEYAPWTDPEWQPLGLTIIAFNSSDPEVSKRRAEFLVEHGLEPGLTSHRWLTLHKIIAYAKVVDNFALAAKVASHISECQMPLDILLLEDFLQARSHLVQASPRESQESHNCLVELVAELLTRDSQLFRRFTMESSFSSLGRHRFACRDPWEIHDGSRHCVCLALEPWKNGDNVYFVFYRHLAQLEKAGVKNEALVRFQENCKPILKLWVQPGAKDPGYWSACERACHSAIDMGGRLSATMLHWLFTLNESEVSWFLKCVRSCVRRAIGKQNEEALRVLLDDKTWPTKYWCHHMGYLEDLVNSSASSWLPRDLRDRLNELESLVLHEEEVLHNSLISHDWDAATEMEGWGVQIIAKLIEDLGARRVFLDILFCNRRRPERACVLEGVGRAAHICFEHRDAAEEALKSAKETYGLPRGTLRASLRRCVEKNVILVATGVELDGREIDLVEVVECASRQE